MGRLSTTECTYLPTSDIGKTSLINALTEGGGVSRLVREGDRTVEVEHRVPGLEVEMDGKAVTLQLYIFDFAGQREYCLTHRMSATLGALYIIAFELHNHRPQHFQSMVMFFVHRLGSHEPRAPVMLVGTHADLVNEREAQMQCDHMLHLRQVEISQESKAL